VGPIRHVAHELILLKKWSLGIKQQSLTHATQTKYISIF
jgi:hypothetical protein